MNERLEIVTRNGQTLRLDIAEDEVKISILKGAHYRGIAKIDPSDGLKIAELLQAAAE
jgi:hypothetical protein